MGVTQRLLTAQRREEVLWFIPSCPLPAFASTSHWLKSPRDQETRESGQWFPDTKPSGARQGLAERTGRQSQPSGFQRAGAHVLSSLMKGLQLLTV